jgi:hypothetical protein
MLPSSLQMTGLELLSVVFAPFNQYSSPPSLRNSCPPSSASVEIEPIWVFKFLKAKNVKYLLSSVSARGVATPMTSGEPTVATASAVEEPGKEKDKSDEDMVHASQCQASI